MLPKAIPAAKLIEILMNLGDVGSIILGPHPTTGNLVVFRKIDEETMRALGWVDISIGVFEPYIEQLDYEIPKGWR